MQWFAEEGANLIKQSENKKTAILVIKNLTFYYFTILLYNYISVLSYLERASVPAGLHSNQA